MSLLVGLVCRPAFVVADGGAGVSTAGVGGCDALMRILGVDMGVDAELGGLGSLNDACRELTLSFSFGRGGGGLMPDMAVASDYRVAFVLRMIRTGSNLEQSRQSWSRDRMARASSCW